MRRGMITLRPRPQAGGIKTAPVVYGAAGPAIKANGEVVPDANRVVKGRAVRIRAHHTRERPCRRYGRPGLGAGGDRQHRGGASASRVPGSAGGTLQRGAPAGDHTTLARSRIFTQKSVDKICEKRDEIASGLAARRVEHETELRDTEAAVRTAQAMLDRAESARRLAEQELSRNKALVAAGAVHSPALWKRRAANGGERRRTVSRRRRRCASPTRTWHARSCLIVALPPGWRKLRAARDAADAELKSSGALRIAKRVLARERELLGRRLCQPPRDPAGRERAHPGGEGPRRGRGRAPSSETAPQHRDLPREETGAGRGWRAGWRRWIRCSAGRRA